MFCRSVIQFTRGLGFRTANAERIVDVCRRLERDNDANSKNRLHLLDNKLHCCYREQFVSWWNDSKNARICLLDLLFCVPVNERTTLNVEDMADISCVIMERGTALVPFRAYSMVE
mmetsp:Transcript_2727/g.4243  ORF Transcript_2727/g.4243 Transcript_2727/m.4243 type:complete len:116 (-) Transcript_2727:34-381(-)